MRKFLMSSRYFIIALCIAIVFVCSISVFNNYVDNQECALCKASLEKAIVTCYACEGAYPAELDTLIDNYGFCYDGKKFRISYELYASNLYPVIAVSKKK